MSKEIDVVALKKSVPDLRGQHLWLFLQTFGVPNSHAVCFGKYAGYETSEMKRESFFGITFERAYR